MGEYVSTLSRISRGYEIYIIVIGNRFGNSAEKVINELFRQLALEIGEKNVISEIIDSDGSMKAQMKFGIKPEDRRPILLIMDKHPDDLQPNDKIIKIQLGDYGSDTDKLKDDLFKLAQLVRNMEFGRILWEERKKKILEISSKIPYVDIVTTALGFAKN